MFMFLDICAPFFGVVLGLGGLILTNASCFLVSMLLFFGGLLSSVSFCRAGAPLVFVECSAFWDHFGASGLRFSVPCVGLGGLILTNVSCFFVLGPSGILFSVSFLVSGASF